MGKPIDMTNQIFDTLRVIRLATPQEIAIANLKSKGAYWLVQCEECGKQYIRNRRVLMTGQSKCDCKRTNLPVDLTGQTFGRLYVERMATLEERKLHGDYKRTYCWCKCTCGNPKLLYYKANLLLTNHVQSCGCLKTERIEQLNYETKTKDLIGQRFGMLTVIRLATPEERLLYNKSQERAYFWCQCDCGAPLKLICSNDLQKGMTKSCGCTRSFGEKQIADILQKNNIIFSREQTFNDLISDNNGLLRFDFAIYSNNKIVGLIECDGEFHREENRLNDLIKTQKHDQIKNEYASLHNLPLLRLKYNSGQIITEEEIINIVRRWLI